MKFFDLHCDTPYEAYKTGESIEKGRLAAAGYKSTVFEKCCQVCAVWLPDECRDADERYSRILSNLKNQVKIAKSAKDMEKRHTYLLSLEGGAVIKRVEDVDRLYADGVRVITLTWNGKNSLAGGANTNEPLSPFGRDVIARMNELNMAVDLSHLNDRSFAEVITLADRVIATHSCSRAVHHVRRNLTDEQIVAIKNKGGIIGICLYPRFLGEGNVFLNFYAHLEHIIKIAGEDAVAIGSDFDGAEMDKRLDSLDKIPELYAFLSGKGKDDRVLEKLFFSNAYKYFKELLK